MISNHTETIKHQNTGTNKHMCRSWLKLIPSGYTEDKKSTTHSTDYQNTQFKCIHTVQKFGVGKILLTE